MADPVEVFCSDSEKSGSHTPKAKKRHAKRSRQSACIYMAKEAKLPFEDLPLPYRTRTMKASIEQILSPGRFFEQRGGESHRRRRRKEEEEMNYTNLPSTSQYCSTNLDLISKQRQENEQKKLKISGKESREGEKDENCSPNEQSGRLLSCHKSSAQFADTNISKTSKEDFKVASTKYIGDRIVLTISRDQKPRPAQLQSGIPPSCYTSATQFSDQKESKASNEDECSGKSVKERKDIDCSHLPSTSKGPCPSTKLISKQEMDKNPKKDREVVNCLHDGDGTVPAVREVQPPRPEQLPVQDIEDILLPDEMINAMPTREEMDIYLRGPDSFETYSGRYIIDIEEEVQTPFNPVHSDWFPGRVFNDYKDDSGTNEPSVMDNLWRYLE